MGKHNSLASAMEPNNDELESFRRQWREEVSARARGVATSLPKPQQAAQPLPTASSDHKLSPRHLAADQVDEEELETTDGTAALQKNEELEEHMRTLHVTSRDDDSFHHQPEKPPTSALEHFEAAAQKEAQGNLGSSLDLYRKAYRVTSHATDRISLSPEKLTLLLCSLISRSTKNTGRSTFLQP